MAIYAGPWSIKDWNGTLAEVFHHCPRFICLHRPLVNLSREYNYLSRHASCCDEELFYRNSDVHVSSSVHLSVGKINQVKKKIRMRRLAVTWSFGSPRSFQFWHFRHERPRTTRPSRHDDPESRSFQEKLWDAGCTSACKEGRCGNEDIIKVKSDKIAPVDQLGADIYLQRPFEPASPAKHRSRSVKQRDKTHSLSTWPEKWR